MIVDTHVHVISEDQTKYPRKSGALPDWVQDLPASTLLKLNREAGIDRTILVQGFGPYGFDNSYAADCAVAHSDQFASVCIVDQNAPYASDKLTYWVKERGVRGLRLFTTEGPEALIDDPRILPLWERASELAIPVCVLMRSHQSERLPSLLELCSAKTPRSSCSAGQEAVLIVKSLQDGVRHHAAGPVEAMPLALHLRGAMLARSRKTGS